VPNEDDVVECARTLRAFLARPELLGAEAAATTQRIDVLLTRAQAGEAVADELRAVFDQHEATRQWAHHFLAPPPALRGYKAAPGTPGPTPAGSRYVCPKCGRVWVRRQAGEDVPDCPIHLVALVAVA
jgi:hypothetical protein